jgi:nucleoside-diphosphate-sugar epimerase
MTKERAGEKTTRTGIPRGNPRFRILVTGGTGFLGKRLVQKLIDEGHHVSVFVRRDNEDMPAKAVLYRGDIRDKAALGKAFSGIDVVYHLAICLNEADPEMWDINVSGTQNVVEMCRQKKIKHLIYMGSAGALGETRKPSKEDMPYKPRTWYEKSKVESEKIIRDSKVPYTIVRTTIILGPNLVWMKIFEAAKKGYPIIGSGKNYFQLVYVDDVVRMLDIVKGNSKAINQIFHVASKDTPTYEEVYKMICEELKCKMTKKHIPVRAAYMMSSIHRIKRKMQGKPPSLTMMRSSMDRLIRNRIISIEKAKRILGFEPAYTTREAIRLTIKYLVIASLGYSDYDLVEIHKVKP